MEDWYFHVLDIAHGIVMAALVFFIFRLLVFRKEGALRVRYLAVGGQSEAFQQRLNEAGVTVEWMPLDTLIDGYGAAHCMTQVLSRGK